MVYSLMYFKNQGNVGKCTGPVDRVGIEKNLLKFHTAVRGNDFVFEKITLFQLPNLDKLDHFNGQRGL